ncbi:P-loop containing nucleoside triphosphate hydrolase protein [Irpex lacteus]|nr:P-loop containing nucleoside triphosphate hydrolase protein [Irpex lacteus]
MEAFQLLSRGGAVFDKSKFKNDVQLFHKSKIDKKGKAVATETNSELPPELDFFKYTQGGSSKRKSGAEKSEKEPKRAKVVKEEDEEDAEKDESKKASTSSMPRQRVTAKGNNVPTPVESFEELTVRYNLQSLLLSNLADSGYNHPTGIQSHGVPILLEKRDLAAISPTGTGKTLAYLLPIMSLLDVPAGRSSGADTGSGVRALILAPTRELAHQIHNECLKLAQKRKWKIVLFSKATASTLADKAVRDKVDVIISTPLRMVAAMQAGNLQLDNVRHVVLDEADRMLDTEFLEQVQEVIAACTHPDVQKAVFSATLPANAEKIAMGMLRDPIRVVVGLKRCFQIPTLLQHLSQPYNPPLLVFVSTQPRASSLAEELVLSGTPNVDCLHAGMTKKERDDTVSRMRKGESWVMVCTEVMARGMDFKGVREVINYDFPQSVQSYVHRIGRTGRAGREGKAVTYFTDQDAPFLKTIANVILQSGSTVPDWVLKLPKPSKMKRREMGKVKRADAVNSARRVGRADAIKKRDMIAGSKRRKTKGDSSVGNGRTKADDGDVIASADEEDEE